MKEVFYVEEEMFLPSEELFQAELQLYRKMHIPSSVQPEDIVVETICARNIEQWCEQWNKLPQNIFTVWDHNVCFFGRKLVSERKISGYLRELNCSQITPSMLFGIVVNFEHSEKHVTVFYYPLTPSERQSLFSKISINQMVDINHPFVFLDDSRLERISPVNGWSLNPMRADNLAEGEAPLRTYTLKWLHYEAMDGKIVYDPACSTGLFLHTIKKAYPNCITIGQDLSSEMVAHAAPFLDQAICGDAKEPGVPEEYCDFVFIRFLNSEVVNRKQAYNLFPKLLRCMKKNGKMIVFGHTPVLLNVLYIARLYNLSTLQRIGYNADNRSIFQYYMFQYK
jgi:SAM-dependent methyltransferase